MRVYCDRCGSKAKITSTRDLTPQYRQLYCLCGNAECGHSFVADLTFSHTLSPSALDLPKALKEALKNSGASRQQVLSLFEGR